ncbi:hypothetical protein [Plastoroseomonas arctica]|uniref:Uncharacterized protein n=1 Tax=Plastoroseomonas arctica TaxID=1509237 RepID=A0AAF1JXY4_9PROT|nr:hypothetical protein [Plastoroseomonas arctica]MBR0656497.1 hypothetical protein [Plastoroseomonas arctica]
MSDIKIKPAGPLGRRLLVVRAAGVAVLPLGLTCCIVEAPRQNNPPPARRTGLTDNDPNDGPGNGRGTQQRRGTGITDNDPNDGPGNGRGRQPVRRNTGLTDRDPSDGAGNGRSGR